MKGNCFLETELAVYFQNIQAPYNSCCILNTFVIDLRQSGELYKIKQWNEIQIRLLPNMANSFPDQTDPSV